jgi:hypothetical protein
VSALLRVAAVVGVAAVATLGSVGTARAADGPVGGPDAFVVLTGKADVGEGEIYRAVVIFDGPVDVVGAVTGDVVAFNGDVIVHGSVGGDIMAFNGAVTVRSNGHVDGDVTSSDPPDIAEGSVDGQVLHQGYRFDTGRLALLSRFAVWLAATVSSFLIGLMLTLLMPRAADATAETARRRAGPSIGWGIALAAGLPILGGILLATLVGGLLGLALLLGLLLIYSVAYAAGVLAFGRLILGPPRPRFVSFLLAWAILRTAALIPGVGGLLLVATVVWGMGALIVAAFRAGRGTDEASTSDAGLTQVRPVPPPPMPTLS